MMALLSSFGVFGQEVRVNPFEITARLPKSIQLAVTEPAKPGTSVANPFDVVPHRLPGASSGISQSIETSFSPLEALPRGKPLSSLFLFWLLVALVAFLSFAIASKRSVVVKAWRGFLNDSALSVAQKEASGFLGSTPYFLLNASFLLNAGVFIFLIARFFNPRDLNNLGFLGVSILLSCILFLSKHIFLAFIGWLYPVSSEVRQYNFLILIFNCVLGLFLIPFNFLVAFVQQYSGFLVFWALGLALVFYAYRSLRAASIGRKFLSDNLFHFLLYLCTVEIAPVFILIKLAMLTMQ
ncbi:MAG: DUF4271 domain-containing protein [Thermoanaerobaculia bacterium]|nr:DUF4271 domain-containing protein [Thermoanaerobaculia bacterium]